MGSHSAGEAFVLINPGALQEIALPPFAIGTSVSVSARGLADGQAAPVVRVVTGEAMRPPSPSDLAAVIAADGGLSVNWVRRSRLGWMWPAGTEVPLGESAERYRVDVQGSAGSLTFGALEPQITIPVEALTGMTGAVSINVVQIGDFAESRPATISLTI